MEQQFSSKDTIANITEDKPQKGLSGDDIFQRETKNKIELDIINEQKRKKKEDEKRDLYVNKDEYDRILLIKHITDIEKGPGKCEQKVAKNYIEYRFGIKQ